MLSRTHINRGGRDSSRMDLISSGIDGVYGGSPLFMDVTIISPLHGTGQPMPRSARENGAALDRADAKNRNTDYPDVEASPHAQLLCLGVETYGRWGDHCLTLIRQLARYKSRNSPAYLQNSIQQACFARWWTLLSVSVQRILVDSITRIEGSDLHAGAAEIGEVPMEDLLDFYL